MLKKDMHRDAPKFEYNQVTNYIYLGTNKCCQKHFKKKLVSQGVMADINLEIEELDSPRGVGYYLWLPTKDHFAPNQKQLNAGAMFLDFLVKNKIKTYVHCKNGHGRSPTLIAAYLILSGKSADESIKLIKKKRKTIHLNDRQILALKKFERSIRK